MGIVELRVRNFQKISAVRIRPDGSLVTVSGMNDQGKTSLLTSIWVLLLGLAAAPAVMIRDGQEECRIEGEFDQPKMKVVRTFKRTESGDITHDVKVTDADGNPIKTKVQTTLDKLIGAYSFAPLEFAKAPRKEQYETLKRFAPGIDFEEMAEKRKKLFEARTNINRRAGEARARAAGIELPPGGCPKAVDVAAALTELEAANRHNAGIEPERLRREAVRRATATATEQARQKNEEATALRARADALDQQAAQMREAVAENEAEFDAMPPIPKEMDTAAIRATIAEAEKVKGIRTLHERRREHEDEAEGLEGEAAALTAKIDALDKKKAEAVAAAEMPVDGLSFGDGEVLFNGLPFSQAGTASKIKTAVAVGMALNPGMKIMTIDEGSELDSHALAMIEEMATAKGFQVWIAKVDESGTNGFVMEDGHLADKE